MAYATTLLFLSALSVVRGHMEISSPYPLRSKFDPRTPENLKDYSMTAPLAGDGSDFACKGYATPSAIANGWTTGTLTAGQDFTVTLSGTATHLGGSGQFALSYDGGKTFLVMASVIGGMPLATPPAYTFTVPEEVPASSKALLAWTWMNRVGNREFYMNCALVQVVNSRSTSWTAPTIFRANTFGNGQCITDEGDEVVFPAPGPQVQYGGTWATTRPTQATVLANCPYNEAQFATVSSAGAVSPADAPPAGSSTSVVSSPAPSSSVPAASSSSSSASSSSPAAPSSSSAPGPIGACNDGDLACSTDGQSFSQCAAGNYVYMGPVASGTTCYQGKIVMTGDVPAGAPVSAPASSSSSTADGGSSSDATTTAVQTMPAPTPTVDASSSTPAASSSSSSSSCSDSTMSMSMSMPSPPVSAPTPSTMPASSPCISGVTILCAADGQSWSLCNSDTPQGYTYMGAVAPGTVCRDGQMGFADQKRMVHVRRGSH